jgi:hypothetical protein
MYLSGVIANTRVNRFLLKRGEKKGRVGYSKLGGTSFMTQVVLNKANVDKLETEIRALIEPERQSFVTLFAERIERQIANFLEKRQSNQTLGSFYRQSGIPEGVSESLEVDRESAKNHYFWPNQADRPAFQYHRHEKASEIIQRISERNANNVLAAFINRTLSKLGPVVERKGSFTVAKNTDRYSGFDRAVGNWEGILSLVFQDGTKLSARLTIITNFSKFGMPFGQYPMRFFDCVLDSTADGRMDAASIEEIWASVGYVLPPPAKKPRWARVVSGSVLLANGVHYLVLSTGKFKKLDLVDYEQVARIETQDDSARVEYQDGTVTRYKFTKEDKVQIEFWESQYKFNKATEKRRELVFQALFIKEPT